MKHHESQRLAHHAFVHLQGLTPKQVHRRLRNPVRLSWRAVWAVSDVLFRRRTCSQVNVEEIRDRPHRLREFMPPLVLSDFFGLRECGPATIEELRKHLLPDPAFSGWCLDLLERQRQDLWDVQCGGPAAGQGETP